MLYQVKVAVCSEIHTEQVWNKQTWSHIYFQVKEKRKMNIILSFHGS
jgi:hypothetical protein